MKVFYKDREALKDLEEPYKTALAVLEELYVEVPERKTHLDYKAFPDYLAINNVRQICEYVKENPTPYISIISRSRDLLYQPGLPRQNRFEEGFRVQYPCEAAAIIGGVYFVLAITGVLNDAQLKSVERIATWKEGNEPFFNAFKKAVEDKIKTTVSKKVKTSKKKSPRIIILAADRGSDFIRVIHSMCRKGYFIHDDKTIANPTEVGALLTKQFGKNTKWNSALQAAFKCDNPLQTFDELRDSAQEYWQERENIKSK